MATPRPRSTRCGPRATAPAAGERADAVDYWLAAELRTRGRAVVDPELPLVATDIDPESVSALRDRGWRPSRTVGEWARIVVASHTRPALERFLDDLDAVAPAEGGVDDRTPGASPRAHAPRIAGGPGPAPAPIGVGSDVLFTAANADTVVIRRLPPRRRMRTAREPPLR